DASFLLFVGEDLTDPVPRRGAVVGEADLVVSAIGDAAPESDAVDCRTGRTPFSLAQQLGLVCVSERIEIFTVSCGNVIERIVLCDGEAEEAVIENIGFAVGGAIAARF